MDLYNTFIVSDLHLAEGDLGNGLTLGTENFFADIEFAKFIDYLISKNNKVAHLIFNGDFVDFIRITQIPDRHNFHEWQKELSKCNTKFQVNPSMLDVRERSFGLKSNDYKCIWKLYLSIKGHRTLFEALARWLAKGHMITIVIGNHDPEWYWPLVQNYFRIKLFELAQEQSVINNSEHILGNENIRFTPTHTLVGNNTIVEHGHNYDRMTKMCPQYEMHKCLPQYKRKAKPTSRHDAELALPIGSFFNRYLINKVEMIFPYADNLTTNSALVSALFSEDFGSAFKIAYLYLGYSLKVVLKEFWHSVISAVKFLFATIIPIGLVLYLSYETITRDGPLFENLSTPFSQILDWLKNALPIILRFIMNWLFKVLGISTKELWEYVTLDSKPKKKYANYKYIILGHNHTPEIRHLSTGKVYINSGTWTKKYVFKYKRIQSGSIYAFVKLITDREKVLDAQLLRWEPDKNTTTIIPSFKSE